MLITLRRKKAPEAEQVEQSPDIKITFGYTYSDYMEANQAHWAGRRHVYAFACAALLVASFAYIYFRPHQARGYIAGALAAFFLLLLTRFFQRYLDFAWSMNRTYKQGFTAEVTGKSLLITGDTFNTAIDWSLVNRLTETQNLFLLYQRSRSFIIVPKRAFILNDAVGVSGLNAFRLFVGRKAEAAMRGRIAA